jgi:hypothetical protein
MSIVNNVVQPYFKYRYNRLERFKESPFEAQKAIFNKIILANQNTKWANQFGIKTIKNYKDFAQNIPIQDYETLKPFIERMMMGEADVLCKGIVNWYSKSSGTTNDKSKYIPVTEEYLKDCHLMGGWDTMTSIYHHRPEMRIFAGKSLLMGGSYESFAKNPSTKIGDISAIMIQNMPLLGKYGFAPSIETALLSNTEDKIEKIAHELIHEDMCMIGGVPTWTLVLLRRVLEITGKTNIKEVWPNLQSYVHGGVGFHPYKSQFDALIQDDNIYYQETYNASEGYFGIKDGDEDALLLLLDNAIFYEFLPEDQWNVENPSAISLQEVELNKNYALVMSNNSGLWRYILGDTIKFTNLNPFKFLITGRMKQFINVFGEELMVANTEKALAIVSEETNSIVSDYTVAPIYLTNTTKGAHEWMIEFVKPPEDIEKFNEKLDQCLQQLNSDYEAKRFNNLAMERLKLHTLPQGTFNEWMKSKGKFGGQNKVPRLSNNRQYVDEILSFMKI